MNWKFISVTQRKQHNWFLLGKTTFSFIWTQISQSKWFRIVSCVWVEPFRPFVHRHPRVLKLYSVFLLYLLPLDLNTKELWFSLSFFFPPSCMQKGTEYMDKTLMLMMLRRKTERRKECVKKWQKDRKGAVTHLGIDDPLIHSHKAESELDTVSA
jgi:hypothetical protein